MNYLEIVGYVASLLIAISLTMSQIVKLRVINLIGSVTFAVYGFFVGAYPVFIVNSFIAFINIYYLIKLYKNKDEFDILECTDNFQYLQNFYKHYEKDIKLFFPNCSEEFLTNKSIFILRNMRPVNLVIYNKQDNNIIEILLDYTIPEYRDFMNGKYLLEIFKNNQLVVKSDSKEHIKYLTKLGFIRNELGLFVRKTHK